jgi:hypothetical protein
MKNTSALFNPSPPLLSPPLLSLSLSLCSEGKPNVMRTLQNCAEALRGGTEAFHPQYHLFELGE